MGYHKSKVDLYFTESGDFALDAKREDLLDTSNSNYRAFIQEILTRALSNKGEWRMQPDIGANINDYLGQPNNAVLGQRVYNSLYNALTQNGFLKSSELKIDVFPISKNDIGILLTIQPHGDYQQVKLSFTYTSADHRLIPRNI